MGYDLIARQGEDQHWSIWRWPRIVQCVLELTPDETYASADWFHTKGDGFGSEECQKLATRLKALRAIGLIDSHCSRETPGPGIRATDAGARSVQASVRRPDCRRPQ